MQRQRLINVPAQPDKGVMNMIKFQNVTKTYNKSVKALDDVSFNVKGGEIVGFIGPNGS